MMMYIPQDGYAVELFLYIAHEITRLAPYASPEFQVGIALMRACVAKEFETANS